MIGDGWDDAPSARPGEPEASNASADQAQAASRLRVCVVTGSRAEFGLLKPVMHAIAAHPRLELAVIAAGAHLIAPAQTFHEVKQHFAIAQVVPMQIAGRTGRLEDVESLARGVARFGRAFAELKPQWVVVLGDRIEAFAAGTAASVGGFPLAHIHGGDRAEGIADEAMRHALTKLAHLHFPATETSAQRIVRMGEPRERVHTVGSPAVDDLVAMPAMSDEDFAQLGSPTALVLMHPVGQPTELEEAHASAVLESLTTGPAPERVLALLPNSDPGREGIVRALEHAGVRTLAHLPRPQFVGLLRRLAGASSPGVLVGNSSAGLIEAAVLGVPTVDIGPRQNGRERGPHVTHVPHAHDPALRAALAKTRAWRATLTGPPVHRFGDGRSGQRIADILASTDLRDPSLLRKRCVY